VKGSARGARLTRTVVADTGAILALLDADDQHHFALRTLYQADPSSWVLPWAVLPEVDYLAGKHLGAPVRSAFLTDLANGAFQVEFGGGADLARAAALHAQYRQLDLGLTDAVVMAVAERLRAGAIATLDLRDFGAVKLATQPRLLPRDAGGVEGEGG
jgi:predicted nucleic acid-binding protein